MLSAEKGKIVLKEKNNQREIHLCSTLSFGLMIYQHMYYRIKMRNKHKV
jgi:hypothetical protein